MQIIDLDKTTNKEFEVGIALGNFDGFHKGHMSIITDMIKESKARGLKSALLLFKNHTKSVIVENTPLMLTSNEQKYKLAEELGIDIVFTLEFSKEVMSLSASDFIEKILKDKINAKLAVVGFDYKFGHKASGHADDLVTIGKKLGIETKIMDAVIVDGEVISSTIIRKLITEGEFEKVYKLLGRKYEIIGRVIDGEKRGRKMGIPTANLDLVYNYALPENGVYATDTIIDGETYKSITDIGTNPTFGGDKRKIEVHIFDFAREIYGEETTIVFKSFMRRDIKFENKELLVEQMEKDLEIARNL